MSREHQACRKAPGASHRYRPHARRPDDVHGASIDWSVDAVVVRFDGVDDGCGDGGGGGGANRRFAPESCAASARAATIAMTIATTRRKRRPPRLRKDKEDIAVNMISN